jgi:hypothetical protein
MDHSSEYFGYVHFLAKVPDLDSILLHELDTGKRQWLPTNH